MQNINIDINHVTINDNVELNNNKKVEDISDLGRRWSNIPKKHYSRSSGNYTKNMRRRGCTKLMIF